MKLSTISEKIPASPIRKLVPYANAAKKKRIKILHLNIGDPDIETPEVMIKTIQSWNRNPVSYSDSRGEHELLVSLMRYYEKLGYDHLALENMQVTFGGSEGILWSFLATCSPGDEVIVFEPFYANYQSFAVMANVRLVPVSTRIEDGFHLPSKKEIEKRITKKTKGILVCNPGNPTGTVYTRQELELLLGLAKKHKLFIMTDEVYREFTYDGQKAISILEYSHEYPEGIIMIDSLSKRYSLCGARLGVLVSHNKDLMETFLKFGQARLSVGLIDQVTAAQLKYVTKPYFQKVNKEYKERRDVLYRELHKIPGVFCLKPEGAFYLIVKLPVKNAEDFAQWMLTDFHDNNETVMIAPAQGFYLSKGLGTNEVRIAYVINTDKLVRAAQLLSKALKQYSKLK
jgi:aspartate aminotransferase